MTANTKIKGITNKCIYEYVSKENLRGSMYTVYTVHKQYSKYTDLDMNAFSIHFNQITWMKVSNCKKKKIEYVYNVLGSVQ